MEPFPSSNSSKIKIYGRLSTICKEPHRRCRLTLNTIMFYWIFINSLLEEYVFRWFITTKSSELFRSDVIGIVFSAAMFTLHHAIALHLFGFIWWQTIIACFGLLSAAAIWSWLYVRFRSIWVCWLSHAICDVAVFGIGYTILF